MIVPLIVPPDQNATRPKNRPRWRYVLAGVAIIILAFGVRTADSRMPDFQSTAATIAKAGWDSPAPPSLSLPKDLNKGPLVINGLSCPKCRIEITANGSITGVVLSDERGGFEWNVNGPILGDYKISAKGKNSKGSYEIPSEGGSSNRWLRVTNKGSLVIKGVADPDSSIEITIVGSIVTSLDAADDGEFSWEIDNARRANCEISARAENSKGNSLPSQELAVNYLAVVRKLSIFVAFKNLQLNCDVVLSKSDPDAVRLLTGTLSFPDFVSAVFGDERINGYDLKSLFLDVTPEISTYADTISVHAASNPNNQVDMPTRHGSLVFDLQDFSENDTMVMGFKDYEIVSFNPPPTRCDGQSATWIGNRNNIGEATRIETAVRYRPFHSPANFFNFIRFNPGETLPYPLSLIPEFLYGFLILIPMIWTLWILGESTLTDHFKRLFSCLSVFFGTILFITPIIDFVLAARRSIHDWPERIRAELGFIRSVVLSLSLVAGIIIVLVFILSILLRVITHSRKEPPNRWLFVGPVLPAASVLSSTLLAFLVMRSLQLTVLDHSGWYRFWPAMIGCLVILPLFTLPEWFYLVARRQKKGLSSFQTDQTAPEMLALSKVRWFFLISSGALIVLIIPTLSIALAGDAQNTFWHFLADLNDRNDIFQFSLLKISYAFSFLPEISLYILFLGILVVLRVIDRGESSDKPVLVRFERLLFVSFIVGISWHTYLVPVPFLLAFVAYRYIMAPADKHAQLDRLTDKVLAKRNPETFDSLNERESLQDARDSLKKKFENGDISLARFQKQSLPLSSAIDSQKPATEISDEFAKESESGTFNGRDLILAFGPETSNWKNGKHAVRYGLWLAIPFAVVYGCIAFLKGVGVPKTFLPLLIATNTLESFADWLILAFFFGYFFKYINGKSGLKKGLNLAVAYTLCILPLVIRDFSSSILAMLIYLIPNFMFLPFLGVVAFDSCNLRQIMGKGYSWKKQIKFEENPTLLAFTTVPFTTLAIAILTFFTGQYAKIIPLVVKLILPAGSTSGHH